MRKSHLRATVLIAVVVLVPAVLLAQQQRFEAVISGGQVLGACFILPLRIPVVEWVNPNRVEESTEVDMVASAPGQPVFALRSDQIVILQPDGTHTVFAAGGGATRLSVAPTGRVFTIDFSESLSVISPAGVQEAVYPLPGASDFTLIEAAADGCTIYYLKSSTIGRFNACTGMPLSDFAPIPAIPPFGFEQVFDIYARPNGEVLIAIGDEIVLHDVAGNVIRTVADISMYGFGSTDYAPAQIALTPDGQVLWIAITDICNPSNAFLLRASMRDDARELSRRPLQLNDANGLVIGSAPTLDAPTASETALLLLAVALAFGGVFLLRR
ncbi:MAG TPA: hypothetical protein VEK79_17120 [Thermoanaerobaculia bacterium]|nr:hypothetical protein [Thermoanaerobaculia bacterium]